jgi:hypothetical protein
MLRFSLKWIANIEIFNQNSNLSLYDFEVFTYFYPVNPGIVVATL